MRFFLSKEGIKSLAIAALLVNLGVLLGRFSGFIRELVVAEQFGVSAEADLVLVSLTLPDLLINLLVGGGLSAALIPAMVANLKQSKALAFQCSIMLFVLFLIIAVLVQPFSSEIVKLLAPGFRGYIFEQANIVIKLIFFILPVFAITGVLSALLHANEKFAITSLGTLIFNSTLIVALLFMSKSAFSIYSIVIAVFIAGLLRYLSQLIAVKPCFSFNGIFTRILIEKQLLKKYFQAVIAGGTFFMFPVVARSFASNYGEGAIASFSYAMRLIEFPLLISVTFISIIFYPRLAKLFGESRSRFNKMAASAIHLVFVLGSLSTCVLVAISHFYSDLVYGRVLIASEVAQISAFVEVGLLAIVFQGFISVSTAALNAMGKTKVPLYLNTTALFLFLGLLLMPSLNESIVSILMLYVCMQFLLCLSYIYTCRSWLLIELFQKCYLVFYISILLTSIGVFYLLVANVSLESSVLENVFVVFGAVSSFILVSLSTHPKLKHIFIK